MRVISCMIAAGSIAFTLGGCVNSGTEPQQFDLHPADGSNVIIKNFYNTPTAAKKELGKVQLGTIFSPAQDNIKAKYSVNLFKINAGHASAMFELPQAICLMAMSGSGKLQANEHSIVMKKGQVIYVPAQARIAVVNDTNDSLMFVILGTPPVDLNELKIIGDVPKSFKIPEEPESKLRNEMPVQSVSEPVDIPKEIQEQLENVINDKAGEIADPFLDPNAYPLKLPDNPEKELKDLLHEQTKKLIPDAPQKGKKTDLQHVQELSVDEKDVPISSNS